jgi:hypothetical protein
MQKSTLCTRKVYTLNYIPIIRTNVFLSARHDDQLPCSWSRRALSPQWRGDHPTSHIQNHNSISILFRFQLVHPLNTANMKFSLALTSLFLSSFVSAAGVSFFSNGQKVLEDKGEAIPGDNPLIHCKKEHSENILVLDHVNLTPNPPVP